MTDMAAAPSGEAMDDIYRYQRLIYDATRRYYLFGRDQMLSALAPPSGGSILEVGCGTARNLILASKRYPDARFFGFDISSEMLKTARRSVEARGLQDRIRLAEGDATTFDGEALFAAKQFDRIYISYALSMIPPWEQAFARAAAHLAPGGELHIVDFGVMDRMPAPARRAMLAWLQRFSVTPRRDLESVAQAIARRRGLLASFRHSWLDYSAHAVLRRV